MSATYRCFTIRKANSKPTGIGVALGEVFALFRSFPLPPLQPHPQLSKEFPLEVCEPDVFLLPCNVRENKPSPSSYGFQEHAANVAEVFSLCRAGDRSSALLAISGQLWKPLLLEVAADLTQGLWNFQSAMQASHLSPPLNRRGPGFLDSRRFLPLYPCKSKAIFHYTFQFT